MSDKSVESGRPLSADEEWIVNFYRVSELSGSLFFGGLARVVPAGSIMVDLTRHYADEARHAQLWTQCLTSLGYTPQKRSRTYQDGYFTAAGAPANLTEILAVTYVFEHRVVDQYGSHLRAAEVHPAIRGTIGQILRDEGWHLYWVGEELRKIADERGQDYVDCAVNRYRAADEQVFAASAQAFQGHLELPSSSPFGSVPVLSGERQ